MNCSGRNIIGIVYSLVESSGSECGGTIVLLWYNCKIVPQVWLHNRMIVATIL